jgi:hypothetical protein
MQRSGVILLKFLSNKKPFIEKIRREEKAI